MDKYHWLNLIKYSSQEKLIQLLLNSLGKNPQRVHRTAAGLVCNLPAEIRSNKSDTH